MLVRLPRHGVVLPVPPHYLKEACYIQGCYTTHLLVTFLKVSMKQQLFNIYIYIYIYNIYILSIHMYFGGCEKGKERERELHTKQPIAVYTAMHF